jgi:hypothetical protein
VRRESLESNTSSGATVRGDIDKRLHWTERKRVTDAESEMCTVAYAQLSSSSARKEQMEMRDGPGTLVPGWLGIGFVWVIVWRKSLAQSDRHCV